jgi:hypothetical protein
MSVRESKADFAGTGHQYAKAKSKVDQSTTCCEKAHAEAAAYPDAADTAPSDSVLTAYDEEHAITYLRLLDADAEGADWREVARVVLHLDPQHESDRAGRAFESHLTRAKWMTGARLPAPATWWRIRLKRLPIRHEVGY